MEKTGKQRTAGFTLVEIIVAIAIMGLVSAPICASLVLAGRINARSQAVMEAQLDVRAAVETLMKDGVTEARDPYRQSDFPKVTIITVKDSKNPYYHVTVSDKPTKLVTVDTYVRAVSPGGGGA